MGDFCIENGEKMGAGGLVFFKKINKEGDQNFHKKI
jgi:hypothetical protein